MGNDPSVLHLVENEKERFHHKLKNSLTVMKLSCQLNSKRKQDNLLTSDQIQQMLKLNFEQIEKMETLIKSVSNGSKME